MSSSSGITCCCNNAKSLCCLTLDVETTCTKSIPSGCGLAPAEPDVVSHTIKAKKWVTSEDDCNCDGVGGVITGGVVSGGGFGDGGGGPCGGFGCDGETTIVSCSATFYGNITEDNHEEADRVCSTADKICQKLACGPCGLYSSGCALVGPGQECPAPGGCQPQECCDPPPPGGLCCCRTIQGCITDASCGACDGMSCDGPNQHKSSVASCNSCFGDGGPTCVYVTTVCTSTENYNCCDDPPGCSPSGCICGCGGGGAVLCNCPVAGMSEGCSGLTGYGVNYANLSYGGNLNSAENRYTSGIIVDSNGVSQLNTLLLFGYGYKNL